MKEEKPVGGKEYVLRVKIENIIADADYYTFNYEVWLNGKLKERGEVNDDYENGNTPKEQIKILEKGEALNLIMVKVFE